jgi:hypothetical protein
VQLIRSGTGRPQRAAAYVGAAVLAFTLVGCTGSSSGSDAKTSTPASTTATAAEAKQIADRMTAALAAASGGVMQVSSPNASVTGSLSFSALNASKAIGEIWTSGTYTSLDKHRTEYILHTGPQPDEQEIYVKDGTPIDGRDWAEVPYAASQIKDAANVLKDHPYFAAVPELVPGVQPHVLPSLVAAQPSLHRSPTPETVDGVELTHYLGSFDGTAPTAGSATTFDLYVDKEGRPARFTAYVNEDPVTTIYGNWGKQPAVRAPAAADIAVIPAVAS